MNTPVTKIQMDLLELLAFSDSPVSKPAEEVIECSKETSVSYRQYLPKKDEVVDVVKEIEKPFSLPTGSKWVVSGEAVFHTDGSIVSPMELREIGTDCEPVCVNPQTFVNLFRYGCFVVRGVLHAPHEIQFTNL